MVSSESQSRVCAPKTCKQLKEHALSILRVQRQRGHKVSGSNPKYYCKVMSIKNFLNKRLLLVTQLCGHSATPWTAACQASLSFTISQSLFKLMSIESMMLSKHLNLCHPLLLLPSISPSVRVFSNEYSELIYFRIDWFGLSVQGKLKSLLQQPQFKSISFFSAHLALWFNSNMHKWLLEKNILDYTDFCWQSDISAFGYAILVCHSFFFQGAAIF